MYKSFEHFVIRVPALPIKSIKNISEKSVVSYFFNNEEMQSAIYTASPDLYEQIINKEFAMKTGEGISDKNIYYALIRYFIRMTTRATPFGLLANWSVGYMSDKNIIILSKDKITTSRLDMLLLNNFFSEYIKDDKFLAKTLFYPNSSLYKIGNKFRYIESILVNNKRKFNLNQIDSNNIINKILKISHKGISYDNLIGFLSQMGYSYEEADNFVKEIINSQILVSDLEPNLLGKSYFNRLVDFCNYNNNELTLKLKDIINCTLELDYSYPPSVNQLKTLIDKVDEKYSVNKKYILQVDTCRKNNIAFLDKKWTSEINDYISFYTNIIEYDRSGNLEKFKNKFFQRYEYAKIPLLEVLDPAYGIGYPVDNAYYGKDEFIEGIKYTYSSNNENSKVDLQKKILLNFNQIENQRYEINLADLVINQNYMNDIKKLPPTTFALFSLIGNKSGDYNIILKSLGSVCAANLIGRFTTMDNMLHTIAKEIDEYEQKYYKNMIVAEISHLPETRVGNILSRSFFREYEIVYLVSSEMKDEKKIYPKDLYLYIEKDELILWSKKLNKRIIPRLTTAHNYRLDPTPLYYFLCDLQYQNMRNSFLYNWNNIMANGIFRPRIKYKNIILSLATWIFDINDINHLFELNKDDNLLKEVDVWRKKYNLPVESVLSDGDNELYINWKNPTLIRNLFSIIKNRKEIIFIEFLYDEAGIVVDQNGDIYNNELIMFLYKE